MSISVSDRLFGRTSLERVERYVVWSLYTVYAMFGALVPFILTMGAPWVRDLDPAVRTPALVASAVLVVAVVGATVADIAVTRPVVETYCGGPRLPWQRMILPAVLTGLAWAAIAVRSTLLQDHAPQNMWNGAAWLAVAAMVGLVCNLVILIRSQWGATLLVVVGGLLVALLDVWSNQMPGTLTAMPFVLLATVQIFILGGIAFSCRISAWLLAVARELDRARQGAARLAIAEERLRFSRDLHDVVGRSLSAISLKAELAGALLEHDQSDKARGELAEVRSLAAQAQADMRAVVTDYRRMDLLSELEGARTMLEAADVQLHDRGTAAVAADLPEPVREALAWVVREGVTNAVRHACPGHVHLNLECHGGTVTLTLTNDGLDAGGSLAPTAGRGGTGLLGLAERLAPLGGTLEHGTERHSFVLRCTLPVRVDAEPTMPAVPTVPAVPTAPADAAAQPHESTEPTGSAPS